MSIYDQREPLEQYLRRMLDQRMPPTFRGSEVYTKLAEGEFISEYVSSVRVRFDHGRSDEHYLVVDGFKLEGIAARMHAGRAGVHEPEALLCNQLWEAEGLDPRIIRRSE